MFDEMKYDPTAPQFQTEQGGIVCYETALLCAPDGSDSLIHFLLFSLMIRWELP
jgi:hypothetical protein